MTCFRSNLGRICLFSLLFTVFAGCTDRTGQRELNGGVRELKRGNYVRAKALLEKSISRRPGHIDNAEAHNYLGVAAMGLHEYEDAATAFEDSRRLNPNLVEPVYNLGVLSVERQDHENALRYLNEAATLNKHDTRALEYLADFHMRRNQPQLARNALYTALDRDPRSPRIYNAIACVHVAMQQSEPALEALMFALESDTDYAPALFNLAVVYDTLVGDKAQAEAYYERFLKKAGRDARADQARQALARLGESGTIKIAAAMPSPPPSPSVEIAPAAPAAPVPPPVTPAAVVTTAPPPVVVTNEAPPPPAEPTPYEKFIRQAEDRARTGQLQASVDFYVRAAEAAAGSSRVDLEEKAYRDAVKTAPDQPRSHALLAQHLYDRGKYDQAAKSFKKASSINPDYAPAQLGLARLAVRDNEYDAAMIHYRKVMATDPSMTDAYWEYAQLYDKHLSMKESAAREYREFAARFPGDDRAKAARIRAEELMPAPAAVPAAATRRLDYRAPVVRNRTAANQAFERAESYRKTEDWERAIFFYLRSLEHDDQLPSTFYNLGICYTMTGEKDSAREAYRQAIRLRPDDRNSQYNLALLYRDSGDQTSAIRLLEEIIRKSPDYAYAHHALGSIYSDSSRTHDKARKHFEDFLRLAPNDRAAPSIRQWLQTH